MKGCPYDNAVAEATFKTIKTEFTKGNYFNSLEDLKYELLDYVNWFNNHRIHSSLGYQIPVEYKMNNQKSVAIPEYCSRGIHMRKKFIIYVSIILTFGFFVGCGTKKTPLHIGIDDWPPCQLWYIAQEKGYLNGTEMKIIKFSNWSDSLSSFSLGKIDLTHSTLFNALYYQPKGDTAKAILLSDSPKKGDGLVTKKGINKISDLKGKKIAVELGTDEHFFLYKALKTANIKDDQVTIVPRTNRNAAELFLAGEVDACFVYEPYLSKAAQAGNILIYVDDMGGYIDVLMARAEPLNNRKKDYVNLINAWYKSQNFVKEHPEEAYTIMASKTGMSSEEFEAFYESFVFYDLDTNKKMFSSRNVEENLNSINKFLIESKLIIDNIDVNSVYTPDILDMAGRGYE